MEAPHPSPQMCANPSPLPTTKEHLPTTTRDIRVENYVTRLTEVLRGELKDVLAAVYLFGSAGYGAYESGTSDIDVCAVVHEPLSDYRRIAQKINATAIPCPSHKLEFLLLSTHNAAHPSPIIKFEMNLVTGKDIDDQLSLDCSAEPRFWFLLDIAMGRELGKTFYGPAPQKLLARPKQEWIVDCLIESLAWYRGHLPVTHEGVLNACRELRFVQTGKWGSKMDGCRWVIQHYDRPDIVVLASHARRSGSAIPQEEALDFLSFAEKEVKELGMGADVEGLS